MSGFWVAHQSTTKELLNKARNIVKNGVEVDIKKYEIAA
jgi:hypothetical protein